MTMNRKLTKRHYAGKLRPDVEQDFRAAVHLQSAVATSCLRTATPEVPHTTSNLTDRNLTNKPPARLKPRYDATRRLTLYADSDGSQLTQVLAD
jgi:hypothetical protein